MDAFYIKNMNAIYIMAFYKQTTNSSKFKFIPMAYSVPNSEVANNLL